MSKTSTSFKPRVRKTVNYEPLFPYTTEKNEFTPSFIYNNYVKRKRFLKWDKSQFENMDTFYGINSLNYNIQWKKSSLSFDDILKTVKIDEVIHVGIYSEIYEGFHYSRNQKVAVKIFRKDKVKRLKLKKQVENEINISQKMDHPNICKTHQILEDKDNIYMIMDYVGSVSLKDLVSLEEVKTNRDYREEIATGVARDIISALNYLHCLKYYHGEVNLGNIVYYKSKAYLVDFGMAGHNDDLTGKKMLRINNDRPYRAPEMLKEEGYLGQTVDIWAFGVALYFLIARRFPFGKSDGQLERRILRFEPNLISFFDEDLSYMVMRMLDKNFKKRPTSFQVSFLM